MQLFDFGYWPTALKLNTVRKATQIYERMQSKSIKMNIVFARSICLDAFISMQNSRNDEVISGKERIMRGFYQFWGQTKKLHQIFYGAFAARFFQTRNNWTLNHFILFTILDMNYSLHFLSDAVCCCCFFLQEFSEFLPENYIRIFEMELK